MTRAKTQKSQKLTADSRRFTQMRIRTFTAETQSTLRKSLLPNRETTIGQKLTALIRGMFLFVVVSRQTKNLILCALCASAVIFLKGFLSVLKLFCRSFYRQQSQNKETRNERVPWQTEK